MNNPGPISITKIFFFLTVKFITNTIIISHMAKISMGRKTPFYPNLGSGFVCPAGTEKENGTCVRKPTTIKPAYVRPDVPTKATGSSQSAAAHLQLATQRKTYTPPSVPRGNHQEAKVNPGTSKPASSTKKKLVLGGMRF